MRRPLAIAAALLMQAGAAAAQAPASVQAGSGTKPARVELRIDVGVQGRPTSLSDSFAVAVYQEPERISVQYPHRGGTFAAVAGHYQVWKQLTLGVGVTQFAHTGDTAVQAEVPHPFFDNQFRSVEGTASTRRQETGVNVTAGWRIPLSDRAHVVVSAGPALVQVKQAFVTGVTVTESYPYDTATFASADVREASRTGTGVYAGADLAWLFSKHLGAGGVVQFTRVRVSLETGDRRIAVDGGGVQVGGGLRIAF